MKNAIVEDGEDRLIKGREEKKSKALHEKHAEEMARASTLRKFWLRLVIWHKSQQPDPKDHQPSPGTLW
jgi:hypothetical protein